MSGFATVAAMARACPPTQPISASLCPGCGALLDATSCVAAPGVAPDPGDLTLCMACMTVLVFNEDLRPRLPWPGELEAAKAADPSLGAELALIMTALSAIDRPDPGEDGGRA